MKVIYGEFTDFQTDAATDYKRKGYIRTEPATILTIHHSGYDLPSVADGDLTEFMAKHLRNIDRHHREAKGWSMGIAYNYVLFIFKGTSYLWKVRRPQNYGFHAGSLTGNRGSVALCVMGDFSDTPLLQQDKDAIQQAILLIKQEAPWIHELVGHNYWRTTACPGKIVPEDYSLTNTPPPLIKGGTVLNQTQMYTIKAFLSYVFGIKEEFVVTASTPENNEITIKVRRPGE